MGNDPFARERRKVAEHPETWKNVRADGKRQCPVCTNSYRALDGPLPVVAHFDYATHRWCPDGVEPTDEQRKGRKKKGSVRTVGTAGLPTLGKRS
jgi:hypothetical protein